MARPKGEHRRSVARGVLLLMLMGLLAYTYAIPRGPLANADTRVALTRAIVDQHTLAIDRYAASLTDRSAYHRHFYTDKSPGVSLLAVPAYALLRLALPPAFFEPALFFVVRYLLTACVVGVPAAVFLGVLWRFLLPLLGRRRAAVLVLGYGFGTMAWALSTLMFSHILAADSLFGAFMLLYPVSTGRAVATWQRWTAAGALCGLAVTCEYPAALVAVSVALFAVAAARRVTLSRALLLLSSFGTAALIMLVPLALYNTAIYGSPFSQGYAHLRGSAEFIHGMGHGVEGVGLPSLAALWGITFSPYRGIFTLSPFLLLAGPGLVLMWRQRQRAATLTCGAAIALMLLFNSSYYFWDGGVSLGPRHFSPALPFLLFPIAFALHRRVWYRLGVPLIALSIAVVGVYCLSVLICLPGYLTPFTQLALPNLSHPINAWSFLFGLRGLSSRLPLVIGETLLAITLWRTTRKSSRTSSRAVSEGRPMPAGARQH